MRAGWCSRPSVRGHRQRERPGAGASQTAGVGRGKAGWVLLLLSTSGLGGWRGVLCSLRSGQRCGVKKPPGCGMSRLLQTRRDRWHLSIRGRRRVEGRQGSRFPRPQTLGGACPAASRGLASLPQCLRPSALSLPAEVPSLCFWSRGHVPLLTLPGSCPTEGQPQATLGPCA